MSYNISDYEIKYKMFLKNEIQSPFLVTRFYFILLTICYYLYYCSLSISNLFPSPLWNFSWVRLCMCSIAFYMVLKMLFTYKDIIYFINYIYIYIQFEFYVVCIHLHCVGIYMCICVWRCGGWCKVSFSITISIHWSRTS